MWSLLTLLACSSGTPAPGSSPARLARLTHNQWENTVEDLLGLSEPSGFSERFVADPATSTFENDPSGLSVSPTLWQQYQAAAESLAQQVVEDPALYEHVAPDAPKASPIAASNVTDAWIASFGRRAFRRDLTAEEREAYREVVAEGAAAYGTSDPFADGVRAGLVAFLQSPSFLYRAEGTDSPLGQTELDPYALASKLSYALWNTTPDDTLLDAAEDGLPEPELEVQVQRMLASDAAHDMVQDLYRQLLHVDNYLNIPRGFVSYEDFSLTEPAVMQAEVYAFIDAVVFGGGTVRDLLLSRRTFADAQLASIYGIEGVEGVGTAALEPVELDPTERSGLLTLSGFLKFQSSPTEPNLIARGAFVNTAFLCADLPPPPASATPLPEAEEGESLRDRIEAHTSGCGGACHNDLINPIGFAFGRYNRGGVYTGPSTQVFGQYHHGSDDIDTTGSYTFEDGVQSYDGAVELAAIMADRAQVHRCFASHLLAYLEGRSLDDRDTDRLAALTEASMDDQPILTLITDIVTDPAFRGLAETPEVEE